MRGVLDCIPGSMEGLLLKLPLNPSLLEVLPMSSGFALSVRGIVKRFGNVYAVRGLSFDVYPGEIFCLVGPNGAGKTTTLRILAGILEPDSGEVLVFGSKVDRRSVEYRRMIAYLPEDAGVPRTLTGLDYLEFIASIYYEDEVEKREAVRRGVELSGLGDRVRDRAGSYSKGMRRRLLLAGALMVNPKIAILDEPTAGLDVAYAVAVRNTIVDYARRTGATIVASSHNMLEVEYICDRVALINQGVIVELGKPRELIEKHGVGNLEEVFVRVVGERG